ncbi:MAG: glycosyltransferase family 39 protein [Candidatus Omnitrophica bacterium]|nr:glycosyltransferase family 39 protein [Candidatus Omnitrophota bacterium]
MKRTSNISWVYRLFFIILVGFILRIYHLGFRDLWYDEIFSISKALYLNFLTVWNPPLYYAILSGWIRLFGLSEISLRFPSLLFSLACIPVIFLLGKELFNKSAGLYASLIIALSPFHLWYAQEARPYSIMVFFGLLSAYFQTLFMKREQNKFLYFYAISSICGLYSNYHYIFLLITQLLWCLIFSGKRWSLKRFIVSISILFVFAPQLTKFWYKLLYIRKGFWLPSPDWKSFLITIENFSLGYNSHQVTYFIFDILSLTLFIAAIWFIKQKKELRKEFIFCSTLFIFPLLLAFIFSKTVTSVYLDRALIAFSPYYYLILGLGISAFRKKILRFFVITSILSILTVGIYGFVEDWMPLPPSHHMGTCLKKPVKPAVEFIKSNSGPNDIIAFTRESIMPQFLFYSQGTDAFIFSKYKGDKDKRPCIGRYRFLFAPEVFGPDWQRPRHKSKFSIPFYEVNELEFERLWVLACDWERSGNLSENSLAVKEWLDKNLDLEMTKEFDGLWIYKYRKK